MPSIPDICFCDVIPGNGTPGGNGGDGGKPGHGGDGAPGGDVFLVSTVDHINKTNFFQVMNDGGKKAKHGAPGKGGDKGTGGRAGFSPLLCPEARPGRDGNDGITPPEITDDTINGEPGSIKVISID